MMAYRVGFIALPAAREEILSLVQRMPVWVMYSPENRAAIELVWKTHPGDPERRATIYSSPIELATKAAWLGVIEDIELHHGQYSHTPPVDELEVVGAETSPAAREALAEYGYTEVTPTKGGFIARKAGFA